MSDPRETYQQAPVQEWIQAPNSTVTYEHMFLRTKYYPVDLDNRVIYDDPKKKDLACFNCYPGIKTTGTRGARLNRYHVYRGFEIRPAPLPVPTGTGDADGPREVS